MQGLSPAPLLLGLLLGLANIRLAEATLKCYPDMPIRQLNYQPSGHMQIFTDFKFSCGGEIAAWKFYAGNTGRFYVTVWRPQNEKMYQIIGKTTIEVENTGENTHFIPKYLRFRVRAGDVMGIHYNKYKKSVIMFEDDLHGNAVGNTIPLSATIGKDQLYNQDLFVGRKLFGSTNENYTREGRRAPALMPIFNENRLRLSGGQNAMEGRAMFYSNGQWGNICDDRGGNSNWPHVFCRELGYSHADVAQFAKDTYAGVGNGPDNWMNPLCQNKKSINMDDCEQRGGTCDHSNDVFVKCSYPAKLQAGEAPGEGMAMAYTGNGWGTICDDTISTNAVWVKNLCHFEGYARAIKATKASKMYTGIGSGLIGYNNPSCTGDGHSTINCAEKAKCTHAEDVFVQCRRDVRLAGGNSPDEGRAEVFWKGQWGTVCMDNIDRDAFPSVFCKDMGYDLAKTVSAAKDSYVGKGRGKIHLQNPDCNPDDANNIGNCGFGDECTHNNDIFIKCTYEDLCNYKPCQNDGMCLSTTNDYTCQCLPGYSGRNCENNIDDCDPNPCLHNGTCIDLLQDYKCDCPPKYTGDRCQYAAMPEDPVVITCVDHPTEKFHVVSSTNNVEPCTLSTAPTGFKIVPGISGDSGAVSFKSLKLEGIFYLRVYQGKLYLEEQTTARDPANYNNEASFFPEQIDHLNNYIFYTVGDTSMVLAHSADDLVVEKQKLNDTEFDKRSTFHIQDLDSQNGLVLYSGNHFKGKSVVVTDNEESLHNHGFENMMNSFEIRGTFSWQLFEYPRYGGKSVIAHPGRYDEDWVREYFGVNLVSSARMVEVKDGLILWTTLDYNGDHLSLSDSDKDIGRRFNISAVQSVEVVGPSSWELHSDTVFKGTTVIAAPGRYSLDWMTQHFGDQRIQSARKVEINTPMCAASSGTQKIAGSSGTEHDVFVVHREDGSVWLRFGQGGKEGNWTFKDSASDSFQAELISKADIAAIKDFTFMEWEVESDVELRMSVDNSWHPSEINVMYLGSKSKDKLNFENSFTELTDITFAADKSQMSCTGRMEAGSPLKNQCGEGALPRYGETTNNLVITSVNMDPSGYKAYAKDKDFSRNAFSWKGSHYYLYAKLAECSRSSGCYERQTDVSYLTDSIQVQSDNRPETFYFGEMEDIDVCEAACQDEPDCVSYTLFTGTGTYGTGCYGVGSGRLGAAVNEAGTFSGKAVECSSFIPEYMEQDMWTKNTTGCPCSFDTSRKDCACCEDQACQCPHRYKYQCTLCGFSDRCGSPFLTTSNGEYIFEHQNLKLSENGRHYLIPDVCVTECNMDVHGSGSGASSVAAIMTDINDKRVLSCSASGLQEATDPIVSALSSPTDPQGVRVKVVNLYSFGGVGEMVQLRLKINKDGCPPVEENPRYVGCFTHGAVHVEVNGTVEEVPTFISTHMTQAVCLKNCYNLGHKYAMLKAGTTCECEDVVPSSGSSYKCDRLCSGDSDSVCGGKTDHSIYKTSLTNTRIEIVGKTSDCNGPTARLIGSVQLKMTAADCTKLTDEQVGGSDGLVDCPVYFCEENEDQPRTGLYLANQGTCGANKKAEATVYTQGSSCLRMGGNPKYGQSNWGDCQLDVCAFDTLRHTIYNPTPRAGCPSVRMAGHIFIKATAGDCRRMEGFLLHQHLGDANMTTCAFSVCMADTAPTQENIYTFNHPEMMIYANSTNTFPIPEMCVTECEFSFRGSAGVTSVAEATFMGENNKEAGLVCGGKAENGSTVNVLTFADKATGVKVSGLKVSSQLNSFIIASLKLVINPKGCKDDVDMLVLYDEPNFGGRPKVIKEDLSDLSTIDFNNKANSFKIYGNMNWELFEHTNFRGSSAVLAAGEYNDMSTLPFGGNQMSSVHRQGTMNEDMDQTRKDISNTRGLVCFKRTPKSTSVFGLAPNEPMSENRPRVFYFGNFGIDIDRCERACRDEPQCAAFTLFSPIVDNGLEAWRGLCYGRSFRDEVEVYQEDVLSGYVASCTEEDTLNLYTQKEFGGLSVTIIEDLVNITMSSGPLSAVVTGKDTWRVMTISDGHVHSYKLAPGEYADLSVTFIGSVFQVSKMNPNTQLYNAQHNQIDLAPVAANQIEKTITKTKTTETKGETSTKKECDTTQIAEIMFVIDASSSVFADNFKLQLDFVVKITESFTIGPDQVRVGVILFGYYAFYDIPLGQHTDKASLIQAIQGLTYYKGGTYTHVALDTLRLQALNDDNVRPGVTKQTILLTDGRSRKMKWTKDAAHLCRDAGITMTAIGINRAKQAELNNIAGDASRVFSVDDFDKLQDIMEDIKKTTCTAVEQGGEIEKITEHITITVQGEDSAYFIHEHEDFIRKPSPLGCESGIIYNSQIFASSALYTYEAYLARLNHNSGWITTIGNHTIKNEWIEIDLGKIIPVHGVSTQGHHVEGCWVTKYKIAISLDGINFVTFKDMNTSTELTFIANHDQDTVKYHCLHRLFGKAILARVIRFIAVEWESKICMRLELYGYRETDDSQLIEGLRKDVWTRNVTGCPCYFNPTRTDCACCEDGGCQCHSGDRHQCVQCGSPHNCGTPSLRNPINNIDGWTSSLSGCRCAFDPLRTDCACCQNYGCQCGAGNKNQCVNCGHPEHCGLKEHIFGPNPYCKPYKCPREINTIWEGTKPEGLQPGDRNPVIVEEPVTAANETMGS